MDESLPKLDRVAYLAEMLAEFEKILRAVIDAVDDVPAGHVIRASEERARDALDRFRQVTYQEAIQMKIDAAEAAFRPSAQRSEGGSGFATKGPSPPACRRSMAGFSCATLAGVCRGKPARRQ
jgi:hypothetical protein